MSENSLPKRLIEVDLPIKRISSFARPERTTVQGNISTLHIWWARRPHAACRAVLCAALWPDPVDINCPQEFRDEAGRVLSQFAKLASSDKQLAARCSPDSWIRWQTLAKRGGFDSSNADSWNVLRNMLLDFIADFAQWANQTVPAYLTVARKLTSVAHSMLGGSQDALPLVFDPFAGGGAIPLEALRVGANAFASDLNPLAVLLNKVVLESIPKFGDQLPQRIEELASCIKDRAKQLLANCYPKDTDGSIPLVYLWARAIQCEGPGCGYRLPLIRALKLGEKLFLSLNEQAATKSFKISVVDQDTKMAPTVKGGAVSCPRCGYSTPAKHVKTQLSAKNGGARDAQLLAVLTEKNGHRSFRSPADSDLLALAIAEAVEFPPPPVAEINPIRPHKNTRGLSAVTRIGVKRFSDLYNVRQLRAAQAFSAVIGEAMSCEKQDETAKAALCIIGLAFGRLLHQNCSSSRWLNKRATVAGAFGKQALQVTWDFAEISPLSNAPGSWDGSIDWTIKIIQLNRDLAGHATVVRAPAQECPLPNDSAAMLFTDPPYFAAIPYSDLANFFYIWERSFFIKLFPDMFQSDIIDQTREVIVTDANLGVGEIQKNDSFFREEMTKSLARARQILDDRGIAVIVFADTKTSSWEALLGAVIDSGWTITASWPIDTENQNRTQAQDSASLQSSIHLVCRPRKVSGAKMDSSDIGDWRDILSQLPKRMHEWMPRLSAEGIVGADAIFACLGPALEVFSRYSRVEKASGEPVTLREYLEQVWAAVAKEALAMVFKGADTSGFEEDARLTAMWLWTLSADGSEDSQANGGASDRDEEDEEQPSTSATKPKGFILEYDAARKIAQGLGVNLESLTSLVELKGDIARLIPVAGRTRKLFNKDRADAEGKARKKKVPQMQLGFAEELIQAEDSGDWGGKGGPELGVTVLDRVHQAMILFGANRGEALRRFLVDEAAGKDERFWRLAQVLSYLYPKSSDEKRWIDGMLGRKKGLGL